MVIFIVKEVDIRKPASSNLKLKILNYLEKSRCAANTSPNFIQVCFDSLYGKNYYHLFIFFYFIFFYFIYLLFF